MTGSRSWMGERRTTNRGGRRVGKGPDAAWGERRGGRIAFESWGSERRTGFSSEARGKAGHVITAL